MSEGSFWPKTWKEAIPLAVWTILIFAAGFEGIAALVHAEWIPSIASFAIMVGLMAMLLHWNQVKSWLTGINPNWLIGVVSLVLLAIIFSPFVEHRRWPFSSPVLQNAVFQPSPNGSAVTQAPPNTPLPLMSQWLGLDDAKRWQFSYLLRSTTLAPKW